MNDKTIVSLLNNRTMVAQSASGHAMVMDGAPEIGGNNLGPRPMEMVLMGLGGCSSVDVQTILEKSRQKLVSIDIEIEAERADDIPKVFTKIHMHFKLSGHNLDEKKVQHAINLSADKYCSVSRMLHKTALITHSYSITQV